MVLRQNQHQNVARDVIERELNTDSRINPSIMHKISMLPTMKKRQNLEHQFPDQEESAQSDTRNIDQSSVFSQDIRSDASQRSRSSTVTRYTISARSDACPSRATDLIEARPLKYNREQCQVTSVADLRSHKGQTATLFLPVIGEDLTSRLEGLKQFKVWNERIHDSMKEYQQNPQTTVPVQIKEPIMPKDTTQMVQSHSRQLHHEVAILESVFDAPTPFSSPQVTPMTIASDRNAEHVSRPLAYSSSPPALDLHDADIPSDFAATRPRSMSQSAFVIVATSDQKLEERARSLSQSISQPQPRPLSRSRSRSRHPSHQKGHPPTSFPQDFYERHLESDLPFLYGACDNPTFETNPPKPEQTKPSMASVPGQVANPLPMSHDIRGRPTFYQNTHHFTTCPHTSPPANRPLCSSAQPRPDPNFYSTIPSITHSIIIGPCFNCDTQTRRSAENDVLDSHAMRVAKLTHQLADLVEQLELLSPVPSADDEAFIYDKHSARLRGPSNFPENMYGLDHELGLHGHPAELLQLRDDPFVNNTSASQTQTPAQKSYLAHIVAQIRALEAQINELKESQDKAVKRVWRGYTSRWGPATLGIQRESYSPNTEQYTTKENTDAQLEQQRRRTDEALSMPDEIGHDLWVFGVEEASLKSNDESSLGSRERLLSRDRSPSSMERLGLRGGAANRSHRDLPGAREPGKGRMRVGWIRDER